MTEIGFIGAGRIGAQIARALVGSGHSVVLSNSRGAATLQPLVEELGARARADTVDGAAAAGDPVIVCVPLGALGTVPTGPTAGKVVVVTSNYNIDREGHVPALDDGSTTVAGILQQHLPASRVVRAFSHISAPELTTAGLPSGAPHRRALALAGDDPDANARIAVLYDEIGFDALDLGPLSESWRIDRGQPAFIVPQDLAELRRNAAAAERSRSGH